MYLQFKECCKQNLNHFPLLIEKTDLISFLPFFSCQRSLFFVTLNISEFWQGSMILLISSCGIRKQKRGKGEPMKRIGWLGALATWLIAQYAPVGFSSSRWKCTREGDRRASSPPTKEKVNRDERKRAQSGLNLRVPAHSFDTWTGPCARPRWCASCSGRRSTDAATAWIHVWSDRRGRRWENHGRLLQFPDRLEMIRNVHMTDSEVEPPQRSVADESALGKGEMSRPSLDDDDVGGSDIGSPTKSDTQRWTRRTDTQPWLYHENIIQPGFLDLESRVT